jgi:hypothetical protein
MEGNFHAWLLTYSLKLTYPFPAFACCTAKHLSYLTYIEYQEVAKVSISMTLKGVKIL